MPVGLSVDLDRDVEGAEPEIFAGHAMNAARWELYEAAEEAGLTPLDEFVSLSPEESEILAADLNFDADVDTAAPAGWFEAGSGLALVEALLSSVRSDPDDYADPEAVLAELRALHQILTLATVARARFRLSVAY